VSAQITLEIYGPGGAGIPIAISPLKDLGGEGQRPGEVFADVIARDLDLSGYFKIIDRGAYIEGPSPLALEEINFQNWATLDAVALVKGGLSFDGEALTVEVRLFDVAQRKQLGGKRYRGERKDLRRMAHRFADEIMRLITGELGPFNSQIAFVSNRAGGRAKDIYVTDLTGTEITQITKGRTLNLGPSWNPAADVLTYFSYKQGGPYPYRLELYSGRESRLYPVVGYKSQWAPDGTTIAVTLEQNGNSDVFLISPEGRLVERLTENPDIDVSPTWSPDGQEIAFCSSRTGNPQIYIVNVRTGRTRRLTFRGDYNTSPAWSPKGDLIAYTSRSGGFRIMTMSADGGDLQEIAPGEDPSWSPDGRYLVFSNRRRLYVASKDGRVVKQLTGGGGDDTSPAWSPRLE
jgi:TolB protein